MLTLKGQLQDLAAMYPDDPFLRLGASPWERLGNAIVFQAIEDYRLLENPEDLKEIEEFIRSDWFGVLTDIDPGQLLKRLKEEKNRNGNPGIEELFETGELV